MKISFSGKPRTNTDLHLIAVAAGQIRKIGAKHAAAVKAILAANPDYKAEAGAVVSAVIPGFKGKRLGLLGLGSAKTLDTLELETVGGKMMAVLMANPLKNVFVDFSEAKLKAEEVAAIASGASLRGYEFRRYRTKNKTERLPASLTFDAGAKAQKAYAPMAKTAEAVHWARDLVNEPSNVLYPDVFAKRVAAKLKPLGVKIKVLDEKVMKAKGFGALLAVGKASEHPPRLVLMEYKGRGAKGKPVALVGKGITFDSGGYSIKPSDSMIEMKMDMAGAAAVAGAMMSLASTRASVHVVAALAMAENMISDEGFKPSDILKSLSGQTIEVTNTDAEGRLVLCDAIWHIQQTYKPRVLVDIATLTGAALVALGTEYAAVFANNDGLWRDIETASKETGDAVWRMPLHPAFNKAMDSHIADMKNASATRYAGSSTGASFIQRYVQDGVQWAHIDMAPTMTNAADTPLGPKGATGYGVRLLASWAQTV